MSEAAERVVSDALSLSSSERAEVVARLLASLQETDPDADLAWRSEIQRRLERVKAGEPGIPLEDVLADMEARIQR